MLFLMNDSFLKKHELTLYYVFALILTSLGGFVSYAFQIQIFSPSNLNFIAFLLWVLMAFSPTITATLLTAINSGKTGLKELFSGFLKAKVSWKWWLAALILLFLPLAVCFILVSFSGSWSIPADFTISLLLTFFLYNFFSGPASEEAGWRGFALPRMLKRWNATTATLVQAAIWIVWHVPYAFVPGSSQSTAFWPVYATLILAINIILNWLYVNSKSSLLITTIAHFCFNFSSVLILGLLMLISSMQFNIIGAILGGAYILLIFICFNAKTFTRWVKSSKEQPE